MINPGNYPLGEGIEWVVAKNGKSIIEAQVPDRPDQAKVRKSLRDRYAYAVTVGPWRLVGVKWVCDVTSALGGA